MGNPNHPGESVQSLRPGQKPRIYFAAAAVPGVLGGVELWCARAATRLRELGYPVGILAAEYEPTTADRAATILRENYERYGAVGMLRDTPIVGLGLDGRPPAWASVGRVARFLGQQVMRVKADVIFPNEVRLAWDGCAAAASLGAPIRTACLIHTDSEYSYDLVLKHRWIVDEAAGVSTTICSELSRRTGCRVATRPIPYGVPIRPAVPLQPRPNSGPLRLGYVGRLFDQQKGVLLIPDVLADLRARGIATEMWVVGEGPDENRLRTRFESLGLADVVRWFGATRQENVLSILASIEVLLMPSFYEGISITLLEAMAQGAVPIVSPVSGMTDAIVDGQTGIILASRSATEMADAGAVLARDRARLQAMSRATRQRAVAEYAQDVHRDRLVTFIDGLLRRPAPPWPGNLFPSGDPVGRTHRWLPEPLGTLVRSIHARQPALRRV